MHEKCLPEQNNKNWMCTLTINLAFSTYLYSTWSWAIQRIYTLVWIKPVWFNKNIIMKCWMSVGWHVIWCPVSRITTRFRRRYMAEILPIRRQTLSNQSMKCWSCVSWICIVAYFCHHLSDNYVDFSDLYVDSSDLYVDFSFVSKWILKTCSCPINAIQITTKLSDKST